MKHNFINTQRGAGDDLMSQVGGAVGGALTGGIGSLLGAPLALLSNSIQAGQQNTLTQQQLQANEQLSAYNYAQQYDLWQKTNYPAQVEQLNKAGLNPALLYAKGGMGGTTGTPSGGIGMGIAAPNQLQAQQAQNMQTQETAADIKLKNAQAENISAQTPQEADLMKSQIDSITQGVNNAKAQEILTDAQTQTQRLTNSIQNETIDDQIANIRATATKIQQESQQAVRNNWMDANTARDKIDTIHGIMIGQFIKNNLDKTEAATNNQQIQQSINQIQQNWKTLGINQQNANTNEGQLKLQQMIKDIPDSKGIILHGLTRLIPNIML